MKKIVFAVLLFLVSSVSFCQELSKGSSGAVAPTQEQILADSVKHVKMYNDSIDYEISLIDSHLNSIQFKWDWISNNAQEKQLATDDGWFEKMTVVRTELLAKKDNLLLMKK